MKVVFVCLGNICRSPMAEAVFRKLVEDQGLSHKITIDSAATSSWEKGNPVHHGTRDRLAKEGISVEGMYSRQLSQQDLDADYLIGMDQSNIDNIRKFVGPQYEGKIQLLLDFTDDSDEIADPWYTGDFDKTYEDVLKGCVGILRHIQAQL